MRVKIYPVLMSRAMCGSVGRRAYGRRWTTLLLHIALRLSAQRRRHLVDLAVVRLVAAGLDRGLRADLRAPASGGRTAGTALVPYHWGCSRCSRGVLAGDGTEWRAKFVEPASRDLRRGGSGLVMLINTWGVVWRVQKRDDRRTKAAAEQGTPMPLKPPADAVGFSDRSDFVLAFVPNALFHGCSQPLPVPYHGGSLTFWLSHPSFHKYSLVCLYVISRSFTRQEKLFIILAVVHRRHSSRGCQLYDTPIL